MPLRCLFGDTEEILAFKQTDESWAALKADYRARQLKMVCCGMPAVPKTSSLGTFFFAHSRRGECTSAPETKEHLLAKTIIAKAVLAAGWNVTTEYRGETPDGKPWIADVLAEHNTTKIAFEVQWSSQQDPETAIRQKQYSESGVRGLWLFRQKNFVSSKEVPAFRLVLKEDQTGFSIKIPAPHSPFDNRTDDDYYWSQSVDLEDFITGCLQKKLKWAPARGNNFPLLFYGSPIECWRCKKETWVILDISIQISKLFPGHPDLLLKIADFEDCPELLMAAIPHDFYSKHGVGRIKKRNSKTAGMKYLSNGCVHCDALQGRFFDHEYAYNSKLIATSEVLLSEHLFAKLQKETSEELLRWHFIQG